MRPSLTFFVFTLFSAVGHGRRSSPPLISSLTSGLDRVVNHTADCLGGECPHPTHSSSGGSSGGSEAASASGLSGKCPLTMEMMFGLTQGEILQKLLAVPLFPDFKMLEMTLRELMIASGIKRPKVLSIVRHHNVKQWKMCHPCWSSGVRT